MESLNALRLPEVIKKTGLCRSTIYLYMSQGKFPDKVHLGTRSVGWLEHEIDAWLYSKGSMRSAVLAPSNWQGKNS